jgi:hypothetical protein
MVTVVRHQNHGNSTLLKETSWAQEMLNDVVFCRTVKSAERVIENNDITSRVNSTRESLTVFQWSSYLWRILLTYHTMTLPSRKFNPSTTNLCLVAVRKRIQIFLKTTGINDSLVPFKIRITSLTDDFFDT